MYLYHYSKDLYSVLSTRLSRADKALSSLDIIKAKQDAARDNNPGSYFESISFFFDPIPLAMIGDHFKNDHHTWFNGNKLNQYIVDTATLEHDILYNIVETPDDMRTMNAVDWNNPKTDTPEFLSAYIKSKNVHKLKIGEQGRGVANLIKHSKQFVGGTEKAYLDNNKLTKEEQDEIKSKYAARVPHLMLYPSKGKIKYINVLPVVVGVYQEHNSTFTSDGITYDLNVFWKATHNDPTLQINVSDLEWVLKYTKDHSKNDEARTNRADLSAPLLVTKYGDKELAVDGLHRLQKAIRLNVKTLPYKRISEKLLKSAVIIKKEKVILTNNLPAYEAWK